MKIFKTLLLIAATAATVCAQASPLEYRGFTRDTDSVVVTGHGHDWLMWTQTDGKSINWFDTQAEATALRNEGWRVANLLEMQSLFSNFHLGDLHIPADLAAQHTLIKMFGGTVDVPCGEGEFNAPSNCSISFTKFKLDSSRTGFAYNELLWQSDDGYRGRHVVEPYSWWGSFDTTSTGLALLRDRQETQPIPEPTSLPLVLLGLFSILLAGSIAQQRKHKNGLLN